MKNKVVFIDWGFFIHTAGWASVTNPKLYAPHNCLNMVISNLKKIGIDPDDKIIIAMDFLSSWRKDYEPQYKEGRKHLPKEKYKEFDELVEKINIATNWHFIKIEHLEADDIMAVGCKYYKDNEVILITSDSDMEQMWYYPNVKIFSPHFKSHRYKIKPENFNVYKLISSKVRKEVADNLVNPILSTKDFDNREKVINLLELPEFVEIPIRESLNNLQEKDINVEEIPFDNIRDRFMSIYNNGTEPYEKSVKYYERKKKKLAKKKAAKRGEKK